MDIWKLENTTDLVHPEPTFSILPSTSRTTTCTLHHGRTWSSGVAIRVVVRLGGGGRFLLGGRGSPCDRKWYDMYLVCQTDVGRSDLLGRVIAEERAKETDQRGDM